MNQYNYHSAYSSVIHARYTFNLFLLLNDIIVAQQHNAHNVIHWHKKQVNLSSIYLVQT